MPHLNLLPCVLGTFLSRGPGRGSMPDPCCLQACAYLDIEGAFPRQLGRSWVGDARIYNREYQTYEVDFDLKHNLSPSIMKEGAALLIPWASYVTSKIHREKYFILHFCSIILWALLERCRGYPRCGLDRRADTVLDLPVSGVAWSEAAGSALRNMVMMLWLEPSTFLVENIPYLFVKSLYHC